MVTVGQNHSRLLQRDPHLTGDIVGMGKIHSKWSTECACRRPSPGPAARLQNGPPTTYGTGTGLHPQNVLEGDLEFDLVPRTVVYPHLRPDTAVLAEAVSLLSEAERPLLLVESGVARCEALDEVVRFAELTGARVYQNWMSDVNFPVSHPQYLGDFDITAPSSRPPSWRGWMYWWEWVALSFLRVSSTR